VSTVSQRLRWLVAAAALVSIVSGCGGTGAPAASNPSGAAPAAPSAPSAGPTSPAGPPVITLAFGGDVHFMERTLALLSHPDTAFGPVSTVLSGADLAMVNLETAVTSRGAPEPKEFHFRAPVTAYAAMAAAGIDVVTVANNHALDYGQVGLADTLSSAAAAGMPMVGAGRNADEAYRPWVTTIKGVRIAVLGMSQISELESTWAAQDGRPGIAMAFDTTRAVAAVKAARAQADVVVVYLHWGQEYHDCPTGQMQTIAAKLAAAGATMIVGTHAHVLLGDGWLGNTFVAYGLSNFLWWYNDAGSNDTGVLRVTLTGTTITKTEFVPAYIDRTNGQPVPSSGAEASRISRKFADLRSCTGLAAQPGGA
jgi:poly-gamma-glutamate capsule biosynthesis protein CapA/YwtB (metallophosphatase superfamily)